MEEIELAECHKREGQEKLTQMCRNEFPKAIRNNTCRTRHGPWPSKWRDGWNPPEVGGLPVNDNVALEREADVMGARANSF